MFTKTRTAALAATTLGLLLVAPPAARAQQTYVLTDVAPLGNLYNPTGRTTGASINARGQVSGNTSDANGDVLGFIWSPATVNGTAGTVTLLRASRATETLANALNNFGQVVGEARKRDRMLTTVWYDAMFWEPSGAASVVVGTATALGINDAGQVFGRAADKKGYWYPFLRTGGKIYDLRADGMEFKFGNTTCGINASGQILAPGTNGVSFLWTPRTPNGTSGVTTRLPYRATGVHPLNDAGQVLVSVGQGFPDEQGAVYDSATGSLQILPVPAEWAVALPRAITMPVKSSASF